MQKQEYLDLTKLYELFGEDKNFINEMINSLIKDIPDTIIELNKYLILKDYVRFSETAHRFKSSLIFVSNVKVLQLLTTVEKMSSNLEINKEFFDKFLLFQRACEKLTHQLKYAIFEVANKEYHAYNVM